MILKIGNDQMQQSFNLWSWLTSVLAGLFAFITENVDAEFVAMFVSIIATLIAGISGYHSIKLKKLQRETEAVELQQKQVDLQISQKKLEAITAEPETEEMRPEQPTEE